MSGSKVYKGQNVMVEGSLSGETIIVTKFAYDTAFNLEYLGEAKIGTQEHENKFFIQKFIYDPAFNLIEIINATNITHCGADQVTIDVTSDPMYLTITIPSEGDFTEANVGDSIFVTTDTNEISQFPIAETNQTDTVRVLKNDIPSNILSSISDEANFILNNVNDLRLTLKNDSTKDFSKRRWDHRERYTYK